MGKNIEYAAIEPLSLQVVIFDTADRMLPVVFYPCRILLSGDQGPIKEDKHALAVFIGRKALFVIHARQSRIDGFNILCIYPQFIGCPTVCGREWFGRLSGTDYGQRIPYVALYIDFLRSDLFVERPITGSRNGQSVNLVGFDCRKTVNTVECRETGVFEFAGLLIVQAQGCERNGAVGVFFEYGPCNPLRRAGNGGCRACKQAQYHRHGYDNFPFHRHCV